MLPVGRNGRLPPPDPGASHDWVKLIQLWTRVDQEITQADTWAPGYRPGMEENFTVLPPGRFPGNSLKGVLSHSTDHGNIINMS